MWAKNFVANNEQWKNDINSSNDDIEQAKEFEISTTPNDSTIPNDSPLPPPDVHGYERRVDILQLQQDAIRASTQTLNPEELQGDVPLQEPTTLPFNLSKYGGEFVLHLLKQIYCEIERRAANRKDRINQKKDNVVNMSKTSSVHHRSLVQKKNGNSNPRARSNNKYGTKRISQGHSVSSHTKGITPPAKRSNTSQHTKSGAQKHTPGQITEKNTRREAPTIQRPPQSGSTNTTEGNLTSSSSAAQKNTAQQITNKQPSTDTATQHRAPQSRSTNITNLNTTSVSRGSPTRSSPRFLVRKTTEEEPTPQRPPQVGFTNSKKRIIRSSSTGSQNNTHQSLTKERKDTDRTPPRSQPTSKPSHITHREIRQEDRKKRMERLLKSNLKSVHIKKQ